ncbi:MAG: alpha/beta fold hydrolase, partial [Rhizorhabdus sp.]
MSPRTRTITPSRIPLNIVEWGERGAPPLILQHGGRDHARSWDAVAAAFADDYHVIAPDLRGHGDSDWASDGAYDLTDYVQ